MEFFPDADHLWWPIAVKFSSLNETAVLSVCRDPRCGVYGSKLIARHCDLEELQQMTLNLDRAELVSMMEQGVRPMRSRCRLSVTKGWREPTGSA